LGKWPEGHAKPLLQKGKKGQDEQLFLTLDHIVEGGLHLLNKLVVDVCQIDSSIHVN
jgi:hypothetical protein